MLTPSFLDTEMSFVWLCCGQSRACRRGGFGEEGGGGLPHESTANWGGRCRHAGQKQSCGLFGDACAQRKTLPSAPIPRTKLGGWSQQMQLKRCNFSCISSFCSLPSLRHKATKMSELKKERVIGGSEVRESSRAFQVIAFTVAEL
jgi:hypothetical protein